MSDSHVLTDTQDGVCHIRWNRPEKKNALTVDMYERAVQALQDAAADASVRCVLFSGEGSAFTAGNDLMDFMNTPPTGEDSPVFQFLLALLDYEKPVVVAVHGPAVGIGVTMLLHCDFVYADPAAKFTTPFVPLGLAPEGGSSLLLPAMAGHRKAAEILLLGEPISAETAAAAGLVTRVTATGEHLTMAMATARKLAALAPASLRDSKRLLRAATYEATKKALYDEAIVFAQRLGSDEAREAFEAFFQKRKPDFSAFR